MENDEGKQAWRLLTTHGLVLFFIWSHPGSTVREITRALDITERQVRRVAADLVRSSMLQVEEDPARVGRLRYSIGRASSLEDAYLTRVGFDRILRMLECERSEAT